MYGYLLLRKRSLFHTCVFIILVVFCCTGWTKLESLTFFGIESLNDFFRKLLLWRPGSSCACICTSGLLFLGSEHFCLTANYVLPKQLLSLFLSGKFVSPEPCNVFRDLQLKCTLVKPTFLASTISQTHVEKQRICFCNHCFHSCRIHVFNRNVMKNCDLL